MHRLMLTFFFFSTLVFGQLPTNGLVAQYDMVTITGGTTLTDLSGSGNNATLHGTTPVTNGITLNGSSDYISMPALVKNNDYTVIVVKTGDPNGAVLWYESDTSPTNLMRLQSTNTGGSTAYMDSTGTATATYNAVAWRSAYHAFYMQRAGDLLITGIVDRPYRASAKLTGGKNWSADACSSIGAQSFASACGSQNVFFAGTIAYFALYTRALTVSELNAAYTAIQTAIASRPVFIPALVTPPSTAPIWHRQGMILRAAQEPAPLYETTGCQLIGNPCFKMWYTATNGTDIAYAESSDGVSWTIRGSSVITSLVDCGVVHVGSTYYLVGTPGRGGATLNEYTSSDGITWSSVGAVLSKGTAGKWDDTGIWNPFIMNDGGSNWYLFYDGEGSITTGDQVGVATSSDGTTWTKGTANPITGYSGGAIGSGLNCQGPSVIHSGSWWYLWCGVSLLTAANDSIGRYQGAVANSAFSRSFYGASILGNTPGGVHTTDPGRLLEVNGVTYLYWADNDGIRLATANMPISQLVQTSEGQMSAVP